MPYKKYTRKTFKRRPRRNYRRKINPTRATSNFQPGQVHSQMTDWYASNYQPAFPNRTRSVHLSAITKGDNYVNRRSNLVFIRNLQYREVLKNAFTTPRYIRVMVVTLRGSSSAADIANFSDIFYNSSYVKTGPTGNDADMVHRINSDEYSKVYDRTFMIAGTTSGVPSTKTLKLNININKYVSFPVVDGTSPRKNATYLVVTTAEAAGITPNSTAINTEGELTLHFQDVNIIRPLPRSRK